MQVLKPGEYKWKETQGGTGWALLRHDPERDTQTRMLRYTRGVAVPASELTHTVEWLVLRGEAWCGPLALRRRGFYCWPAGQSREEILPGEDGYTVLSFVYGPESRIRKPAVSLESVDALSWEGGDPLIGGGRLPTRALACDAGSGASTQMIRLEAEAVLPRVAPGSLVELFVVEGTVSLEGERFPPTTYAVLEPGHEYGPLAAAGGPAVLLLNGHGRDSD